MKTTPSIIAFIALAGLAIAEEAKPQISGPCKEAPEIIECKEELTLGELIRKVQIDREIPEQKGPIRTVCQPSETEAIPKQYAGEKAVAIKIEGLTRTKNGYYQIKLRIINPTAKTFSYRGYSVKSPITKIQHWRDGKWVDENRVLRCGTGLRACYIQPGRSGVFETTLEGDKLPTRIGIAYRIAEGNKPVDVWSEKVER